MWRRNYAVAYRPDDEIIVTVGVSEAIDLALRALVNPGDKVLYHQPCYVSYHPSVALAHGSPSPCPPGRKTGLRSTWRTSSTRGSRAARSS